jgi:hypothetical protein
VVDIVPSPQSASQSLVKVVTRARAGRKFLLGGYKEALRSVKVNGQSVGEELHGVV